MKLNVPDSNKIAPFLVFYIITSAQIGIGALGFQRMVAKEAGTDGWISIIIGGIILQLLMMMIYKILNIVDGDFFELHSFVFGENISKFLTLLLAIYFTFQTVTIFRGYIEVVQTWMFPKLSTFWFGLAFILLVIYIIYGGFRTVVGISVFSLFILVLILPFFLYTIPYVDPSYLEPVLNHKLSEILNGVTGMSYSFIGYEIILLIYPFIKAPRQSKKWAHYALLFTTCFYLYLAFLAFMYFPLNMLNKEIWPSTTMWKIIGMPFVERFEYIGVAAWFIVILSNICLYLWAASRLLKQSLSVKQRISVPFIAVLCLIAACLLKNRNQIAAAMDIAAKSGIYLNFIYIPILSICVWIAWKVKNREKKDT